MMIGRFGLASVVFAMGCRSPAPPTIVPDKVELIGVSPRGLDVRLTLKVNNPNRDAMSARSVAAKVTLDGQESLGTMSIKDPIQLPPGDSVIAVPLASPWEGMASLMRLAAAQANIPYEVAGTVNVGGDRLNLDLPFRVGGSVTREMLITMTLN